MWLTLGRKSFFVNICPLLLGSSKELFKQIQIFLKIWPFSNMLRKTNFLSISVHVSHFWTKKRSSLWISPKCIKTTLIHNLAVCGSLSGEERFCYYLSDFTGFIKKCCLNKSKFSSGFTIFKHVKGNKVCEYFCSPFWDSHFLEYKEKFSVNFREKASKQHKNIV